MCIIFRIISFEVTKENEDLQFVDDFLQIIGRDFALHDLNHLLPDSANLQKQNSLGRYGCVKLHNCVLYFFSELLSTDHHVRAYFHIKSEYLQ